MNRFISVLSLAVLAVTPIGSSIGGSPGSPADAGEPGLVIAAAGDISCPVGPDGETSCRDGATSLLLAWVRPFVVLTLGDNQYDSGALEDFQQYYDDTWGRYLWRTMPSPGNHEYETSGAAGYFDYYGRRAGPGYYSFDLGPWHLVSLNSEIAAGEGSDQYRWLEDDLDQHADKVCTLAYWHKPRWGSSDHGSLTVMEDIWNLLYDRRADLVLSGHNHQYERFAPLDKSGLIDTVRGMREFVVGTGGKDHVDDLQPPITGSEMQDNGRFGVLELTLHPTNYEWRFLAEPNAVVIDSGTQAC
jgi:acid phosphatase type 7